VSAKTLVTGATGFIGRYVIRKLLEDGVPVRVLVRSPERLDPETASRLEVMKGDLRDGADFSATTDGAHTVLHLAAYARAWSRDPFEFHDVNVRAVERLIEASQRSGVRHFVHVSTVLTLPPYRPAPVSERVQRLTAYEETKLAGERLVEAHAGNGLGAVIVHPTRVYGPGPLTDANGVTRVVALYLAGRFRMRLRDGDVLANYVHVEDVATGIVAAARHGRPGAHYMLGGGENISFRQFLDLVAELSGSRHRTIALPASAALTIARAAEVWARLGGGASITPGWVRVFLEDRRADITASRNELGYQPRPLRDGLSQTVRWLLDNGR
jgi:nucleoside-diphosphate-sugar epimerase